jgi:hypothetical protein
MIPVYSLIKTQLENVDMTIDLTEIEKQNLVQKLINIDKAGLELIYCIIRSYDNDKGSDNTLPFNGKIQKSGIRFELDSFDIQLKYMLKNFIEMHNERS